MTMNRLTKKTTALLSGIALVGATQLAYVQPAEAGGRGGVHYGGGHGGPGGPGGGGPSGPGRNAGPSRHGGPGGPGGHNNTRRA
ncbi:MAG: hypothetical protein QNL88_05560, partial [Acidobacteriota bacterium]|nr:hypothetical protein [Acidobacteriota bacterium]